MNRDPNNPYDKNPQLIVLKLKRELEEAEAAYLLNPTADNKKTYQEAQEKYNKAVKNA